MVGTRYIISDASKQLEVEPHVLRYWEEELELDIPRNELGHRYFREEDLNILKNVKKLKEQGLQLKAIKMLLTNIPEEDKPYTEVENELSPKPLQKITNSIQKSAPVENNSKIREFQEFIKGVLQETLKENNLELKEELTKEVSEEIKYMLKEKEQMEERRYKKLDETLRVMQKMRQEIATSSNKKRFMFKKQKVKE
ncbi:MAG: MerR family transcriptional regulator [Vallitalea sp.]|jgi:DNA-binding transcriptional MerR regulator|nr:MerR family transcriptional regulator [Vallitalea sp.]